MKWQRLATDYDGKRDGAGGALAGITALRDSPVSGDLEDHLRVEASQ